MSDSPSVTADVVEIARRFIRVPSPNLPGDERLIAAAVTEVMAELGLEAPTVIALEEHRPNLVSTIEFGPGGRHLVLAAHIDTKPVGDAVWTVDPFGAEIDGDRLYGLGSADMKGAAAAMLVAARALLDTPPPAGRLTLVFDADEENGAKFGAQHLCRVLDLDADAVVIGEPGGIADDYDRLHLVSRGIARMTLTARARQGHSSLSALLGARNAGVDVARAVTAVVDGADIRIPENEHGLTDWNATVNAALTYRGGVGYGVLPGQVTAVSEVRVLPGMTRDAVHAEFERAIAAHDELAGADLEVGFDAPPNDWIDGTVVDPAHPIVAASQRAALAVLGRELPLSVFPGTTDATWFDQLSGIPSLPAFGPGLLSRCHGADEWVSVAALRSTVDLYVELAGDFCSTTGSAEGPATAARPGEPALEVDA
jgi:acetylornithine deacetylase/succinyl-diaminopimelate desuccinylase-like protein